MNSKILLLAMFLLTIQLSSAEAISLTLGQQYNFTVNNSSYALEMLSIETNSSTFVVSGLIVNSNWGETKTIDLNGDGRGEVTLTLDQLLSNSTVVIDLGYNATETPCRPISEKCAVPSDCCVGNCLAGSCAYPPTFNTTEKTNASLDVPANVSKGSVVKLLLTGDDGNPLAGVTVNVITPSNVTLNIATNESGEGSYIASEEGNYSYIIYNYQLTSNKTTLSAKESPPVNTTNQTNPNQCGDGICSSDETCDSCQQDCGACMVQTTAATTQPNPQYSWIIWLGLMLLIILIILQVFIPIFVRE